MFCPVYAQETYYKVLKVVAGDTFYVDFDESNSTAKENKVRVNGIDTFETKIGATLRKQAIANNITLEQALKLGYLAKKFAEKHLLNHYVKIDYSAKSKRDYYGRHLVSIYYDCNKNGDCKSYEEEILKAGYAFIYKYSNHRKQLKPFLDTDKIHKNANKTKNLDLVVLNKKNNIYHEIGCQDAWSIQKYELIKRPLFNFKNQPASYCQDIKSHNPEKAKTQTT